MATFSVRFLGCKVSHADAQEIRERLLVDGHVELQDGDVAVVNGCCVTNEAVAKSRKEASRASRTHRRVYVTGCGANLAGDAFAGLPENVVARRVAQGHREVVFTGINLGCYRDREAGYDLARLVREAGATPMLARLRLSSIEVNHVDERLERALRETPTVTRHLHVPLQSGDDGVLRAMARRYTTSTYLRRLERFADFNLTTDAIVGFPGEDERAFANTLRLVRDAGITKVHVFPYSPRPRTATEATDSVPSAVKKERGARLRDASRAAMLERCRAKVGSEDDVLVDRPGRGYRDDYSPWLVDAPVGAFLRVRAAAATEEGILAA